MRVRAGVLVALALAQLSLPSTGAAQWGGFVERGAERDTNRYTFEGAAGANENYYDGDMGDYDGDGRIDRAVISRYGLLWGRGDGVFIPVSTQRDGTVAPNTSASLTGYLFGDEVRIGNDAVQWVDLDGDGDLDVVQGGNGEPFVVQMNRGGRFAVTQRLTASAVQIVTTDLERDGDADLVVASWFASGPDDFTVFLNDGSGTLSDVTAERGLALAGNEIIGVASGDLDRDGDFDLAIISRAANQLWIFSNDGSGRFSRREVDVPGRFRTTSGFDQGCNLGDIDGDGDLDIVVATSDYVGSSTAVGHLVFVNDGSGRFTEDSGERFVVDIGVTGRLIGANGKLMDVDYDGDLDFFAFTDLAGPPLNFQLYSNDGAGRFSYTREGVPTFGGARPTSVGADVDVADLDSDGTYDVWVGIGGGSVSHLHNTHAAADGLPADQPRAPRAVVGGSDGVRFSWQAPAFAASARHYIVYRSLSRGREMRDRERLRVVGLTPFEDEGFAAPLGPTTSALELADPSISLDGDRVEVLDRSAVPGVEYFYSVAHVGPENATSVPTTEVSARLDAAGSTPPQLTIVSPGAESWGASPRIVVTFSDDTAIDESTLSIVLDQPLGSIAAGEELAGRAIVRDGNVAIIALESDQRLPLGAVTLTARVADVDGNMTSATRTFGVTVAPGALPDVRLSATPTTGPEMLEVGFDATGSVSDGELTRWEWFFGDGATALGRTVTHSYGQGSYDVWVRATSTSGAVSMATTSITVTPCSADCGDPDAGPMDASVPSSDGGSDAGASSDGGTPSSDAAEDRIPARGGCAVGWSRRSRGGGAGLLVLAALLVRRRRERRFI